MVVQNGGSTLASTPSCSGIRMYMKSIAQASQSVSPKRKNRPQTRKSLQDAKTKDFCNMESSARRIPVGENTKFLRSDGMETPRSQLPFRRDLLSKSSFGSRIKSRTSIESNKEMTLTTRHCPPSLRCVLDTEKVAKNASISPATIDNHLIICEVNSVGTSGNHCQIEILAGHRRAEHKGGTQEAPRGRFTQIDSVCARKERPFTAPEALIYQRTETSDADSDISGTLSVVDSEDAVFELAVSSKTPLVQSSVSSDRVDFDRPAPQEQKKLTTEDTGEECLHALTKNSCRKTAHFSREFFDLTAVEKTPIPHLVTAILETVKFGERALEIERLESNVEAIENTPSCRTTPHQTVVSFEQNFSGTHVEDCNDDATSDAFTKLSRSAWNLDFSFWSLDSLRVQSTLSPGEPQKISSDLSILSTELENDASRWHTDGPDPAGVLTPRWR